MTILAIDDEPVMLVHLETELRKVFPKADIVTFDECDEVLAFLETPQSRSLHYAFMDIKLRGFVGHGDADPAAAVPHRVEDAGGGISQGAVEIK